MDRYKNCLQKVESLKKEKEMNIFDLFRKHSIEPIKVEFINLVTHIWIDISDDISLFDQDLCNYNIDAEYHIQQSVYSS